MAGTGECGGRGGAAFERLLLIVSFTALKLIHELWHGVVAKRFGAPVPEWGVRMLALVTPLTYVDASATWRFSSR